MNAGPPCAVDPESRLHPADHECLRLWLRLFTCKELVERTIRARLRAQFRTTVPRFDLMAQLERHPDGLRMGELSQRLLVTGGNVTAVTDQLVAEGLVARVALEHDRRAFAVRLTARGRRVFAEMARAHEAWVTEALGVLDAPRRRALYELLGALKRAWQNEAAERRGLPARRPAGTRRGTTASTRHRPREAT